MDEISCTYAATMLRKELLTVQRVATILNAFVPHFLARESRFCGDRGFMAVNTEGMRLDI